MKLRILLMFCFTVFIFTLITESCKKSGIENNIPYNPTYINLTIPAGWPMPPTNIFANNPLTEEGFQLGKKLFYDGRLSQDGHFPCASCHESNAAFATYDHDFSHGINNTFTTRNAPVLFNLAWMTKWHLDGAISNFETQPSIPITANNQMGETVEAVLAKLRNDTAYPKLFGAAFGSTEITNLKMYKALVQFISTIVSYNSKYDKVQRGEASFTVTELNGYNIFKAKCETCHKEPLFTDNSFRNNGLPLNSFINDFGQMGITNNRNDSLKFKVPSLRNIFLSFPYMHDGRIYSIGAAIDHYRTGIITTQPTLDPLLVNRIAITATEKNDLLFFLNTLTDTTMTKNPRFNQ